MKSHDLKCNLNPILLLEDCNDKQSFQRADTLAEHFNLITHHQRAETWMNPNRLHFSKTPFPDWEVQLPAYTTQGMHGHSN